MTPLEIRIIAYAIALGLFAWGVHTLDAHHYERVAQAEKLAQDTALQEAQRNVIAAQAAQKAAETKAENEHALLVKADTASRDAVLGSVRSLETALHLRGLPTSVGNPGAVQGSAAGTGSDPELERAIAKFDDAVDKAVAGCQHDSGHYAYILSIEPKVSQ